MSLVPFDRPAPERAPRISWIDAMDRGDVLAERIANTDFVPKSLRGNPPAILAAILYGHEIGFEPMRSLTAISVIEGKPTLSAEAMRALIQREGHRFTVEEATTSRATVAGKRRDESTTTRVTWTLDDAKRARIAGKPNWQAYPRQMLVARATAELARQLFADVIAGLAVPEEFGVYVEAELVDESADKPKTATRRRRAAPSSNPAPETPDPPLEPDREQREQAAAPGPAEQPIETIAGPDPFGGPVDEPVPPDPEPAPPDPPNPAALRKMFVLFDEKFPGLSREERIAFCNTAVERTIASSAELSALDVTRIIEALERAETTPASPNPSGGGAGDLPADEQALIDEAKDVFNATERPEPPLEP